MEQHVLLRCAPSYTTLPVEKQRLSRILCGFLHVGVQKSAEIACFAIASLRSAAAKQVWRKAKSVRVGLAGAPQNAIMIAGDCIRELRDL